MPRLQLLLCRYVTVTLPLQWEVFTCHFYNFYFAHTAGGRMIGNAACAKAPSYHPLGSAAASPRCAPQSARGPVALGTPRVPPRAIGTPATASRCS